MVIVDDVLGLDQITLGNSRCCRHTHVVELVHGDIRGSDLLIARTFAKYRSSCMEGESVYLLNSWFLVLLLYVLR